MTASFVITPLSSDHDRKAFSCGVDALDRYLQIQSSQDVRRHIANCFVASPRNTNLVAGYYTLSATSLALIDLPEDQTKRLPRYPVLPATLIGRLAVDRQFHGRKLGAALLFDAMGRAVRAEAAAFAIVVDAKDDAAASFYRHHEFQPLTTRTSRLFLPVATAIRILES